MGLEQYIINFVAFVNNIAIPFLLGIAFLFFVYNAVRFFVVGGANPESKEKARSLAVYGVLAFVLIMTFWGITVLLTSSLGLNKYATYDNSCFDYDPLCNDGVDFGTGPTTRPSLIGRAGDRESLGPPRRRDFSSIDDNSARTAGESGDTDGGSDELYSTGDLIPRNAGNPQVPSDTRPPQIPIIPGRVAEDIEDFASTFNPTEYGSRLNSVIESSIAVIADPNANTEDRATAAVLLEANGYISESQLSTYIGTLDNERATNGLQSLNMQAIRDNSNRLPDELIREMTETRTNLFVTLAEGSRRFYDIWGAPDRNAQADATALLEEIYDGNPADPARIEAFDQLLVGNEDFNQTEIAAARSRMIEEMNAERFYAGFGPIAGTTDASNSGDQGTGNQNVGTNSTSQVETSVANAIPDVQNNFLTMEVRNITNDETTTPAQKLEKARSFEEAGFITTDDYRAVADTVNQSLVADGQEPLSQAAVAQIIPDAGYVESIEVYRNNVETSKQIITNAYRGTPEAAEQIDKVFNTEDYTLEERQVAAGQVYQEVSALAVPEETVIGISQTGISQEELSALEQAMYGALGIESQLSGSQP